METQLLPFFDTLTVSVNISVKSVVSTWL